LAAPAPRTTPSRGAAAAQETNWKGETAPSFTSKTLFFSHGWLFHSATSTHCPYTPTHVHPRPQPSPLTS
jgi:hypothetical protein